MTRAIGYIRVSTHEQNLGPEAQREQLLAEAKRRCWDMQTAEDKQSGGDHPSKRPGLTGALTLLERGAADVLVVTRLDRIARSTRDTLELIEQAQHQGWEFVALDMQLDTTTPVGRMVLTILAGFAQFERELIAARIKDALAVKKSRGEYVGGVPHYTDHDRLLAFQLLNESATPSAAALKLFSLGVTTRKGKMLSITQVRRLASEYAEKENE